MGVQGFIFSGPEVLTAAVEQLEAAQGVNDTPFASVRMTLKPEGEDFVAAVDAFQVSWCEERRPSLCGV
jgi:hypothetical protein